MMNGDSTLANGVENLHPPLSIETASTTTTDAASSTTTSTPTSSTSTSPPIPLTPSELALREKLLEKMREKQAQTTPKPTATTDTPASLDVSHTNGNGNINGATTTSTSTDSAAATTTSTATSTESTGASTPTPASTSTTASAAVSSSSSASTSTDASTSSSTSSSTSTDSTSTSTDTPSTDGTTAAPAKRKSRWAVGPEGQPKKSRWGSETEKAIPSTLGMSPQQIELVLIQTRLEEIQRALVSPEAALLDEQLRGAERSPSPEPIYNDEGRRINTRAKRLQDKLNAERRELIEKQINIRTSLGMSVAGITVPQTKQGHRWEKRIPIPTDKYPDYNFQGIIIGPRGIYQKRLENETGCLIAVRGQGCRGRRDGSIAEEDTMPIHVYIRGTSEETLAAGVAAVEKLLIPMDPVERSKSLKELAILNGTYRGEVTCRMCGEQGHIMAQCPQRSQGKSYMANIECSTCGSRTHATMDCPQRTKIGTDGKPIATRQQIDSEYNAFMEELIGGPAATKSGTGNTPLAITHVPSTSTTQQQPPPPPQHQQPPPSHHHYPSHQHHTPSPPQHHYPPPPSHHQPYSHQPPPPSYAPAPHHHPPPPPPSANPYAAPPPPPQPYYPPPPTSYPPPPPPGPSYYPPPPSHYPPSSYPPPPPTAYPPPPPSHYPPQAPPPAPAPAPPGMYPPRPYA